MFDSQCKYNYYRCLLTLNYSTPTVDAYFKHVQTRARTVTRGVGRVAEIGRLYDEKCKYNRPHVDISLSYGYFVTKTSSCEPGHNVDRVRVFHDKTRTRLF